MTINYGWFANIPGPAALDFSIPSSSISSDGSSLSFTARRGDFSSSRFLAQSSSTYIGVDFDDRNFDVRKGSSNINRFSAFSIDDNQPHYFEVISGINPSGGAEGFNFILDESDRGWQDAGGGSNGFWDVSSINSTLSGGSNGSISRATVKSDAATIIADWDANSVLNAAGDAFIPRTQANDNPSLADSGFDLKLYDVTSVSGNHVDLPSGTTWTFVSNFALPASVTAGETFNFTAPSDFQTEAVTLGGLPLLFAFATPPDGTADAPVMGNVAGFPRFGTQQIQLRDDTAGLTAEQDLTWEPSGTYEYVTLTSDPSTTDPASICKGWTDPLVAGDQVVYDPAVFTVSGSGIISLVTTSETFSSQYYIIDDNGMQEDTITQDSAGVVIPTVSIDDPGLIPTNTPTTITADTTDAATFLWEVLSKTAGSTVTFENANVKNVRVSGDTDGGTAQLRLTGTNAAGDGSANDTITVNFGAQSTLNLTVTGIPDGAQAIKLNRRDTGAQVFSGNVTFSGQSAAISVGVATSTELYGIWFGDNPPATGAGLYGVTE